MTTRRALVQTLGGLALGAVAAPRTALASLLGDAPRDLPSGSDPLRGIGVQLYTLRSQMRADPEGTLRQIAALGYTEIEWWGEFGRTPQQLRGALDALGLRAPAWHVPVEALRPDRLDETLRTAEAMGHRHLIVAWTAPAERSTEGFKRLGGLLSAAGRRGADAGIRTGYHNHDFEFEVVDGVTRWDLLVAETDATVVDLELDCYWAFKAGHDPIAMLERLRGRITHLHLKDSAGAPEHRQVDLGRGVIDWARLLRTATAGRVQHVFVEHDAPQDAWETVRVGREYLRGIGY